MHTESIFTTALLCFPTKTYTLAGFEPGSSVLMADAMSNAPRRQGSILILLLVASCPTTRFNCSRKQTFMSTYRRSEISKHGFTAKRGT
jgi:hypothetical protein